jgi:hypothetical protein
MAYLDRIFETASESVTIPNPLTFTGALAMSGTLTMTGNVTLGTGKNLALTKGLLNVGVFASAVQGSGVALTPSGTGTAAVRFYSDDAGAVLTPSGSVPDIRGTLSRTLLTVDHSAANIRVWGLMGQLKSYDSLWNGEQVGAVHGRLEIVRSAATLTLGGYGISAAGAFTVGTSGTITVNTNHILAGVAAISDFKATLTQTGKTTAFYAGKYDTTNWSDSTSRTTWKYGLYIQAAGVAEGIRVGESANTDGSGVALSASQTAALRVHADTGSAALTASNTRAGIFRYLIGTAITTGNISTYGLQGQLKMVADVTVTGNQAGLCGYLETSGSITLTGSVNCVKSGVAAYVDVPSGVTIGASSFVSAFGVNACDLGGTHTGKTAILHVSNPSAGGWDYFAVFSTSLGDMIAANTHSIDSHALSYILKVYDPAGNAGYIPVLAAVPS